MGFLVCVEGMWIEWNPPVGLVDAIGQKTMWVGAGIYARAIQKGESEADAQEKAERAVYSFAYRVQY